MQDSVNCPRRCSALAARELARLDIDTAAVSEVGFAIQGSLTEDGAGSTLLWSRKKKDEHASLVSVSGSIARKLQNLPISYSDRLMSLTLPIQDIFASVISL